MRPRSAVVASIVFVSLAAAALADLACGSQGSACNAPQVTSYDCTPVDPDAGIPGCLNGPAAVGLIDVGKLFPGGCRATTPLCSPLSPKLPETCACESDVLLDGGLAWICPVP